MRRLHFAVLFSLFIIVSFYLMGSDVLNLIYFAFRSFVRMLAAYFISILFSFFFGILIIHNKKAYDYVFPVLDILQAIPILGFFPFALAFFVFTFPGGMLGEELSSIFLIFTSMTWAIAFAVVESGASLTNEMRDLAKIMNVKGVRYLTHVVFPVAFPQFVSGSITGWGGGWYFLVAGEYLALGNEKIALPGLGAFIAQSAFSYNILNSLLGVAMLAFLVFGMNIYVWQPLLRKAKGYSFGSLSDEEGRSGTFLTSALDAVYAKFCALAEKAQKQSEKAFSLLSVTPEHSTSHEKVSATVSYALTAGVFAVFLYFLFFRMPSLLEDFAIVSYIGSSLLRIFTAFLIALVFTSAIAIFFARNRKAMALLMPLFDMGQSIPAVAVFPVMVVLVVQGIGGRLGLEVASVLLVLTGMVWYLLFNLIRAVQNIPDDVMDISRLLNLGTLSRLRHLLIPAIMPAIFVGGLEAMGGGWNASIISEYIIGPAGKPFELPGLGYLLSLSAAQGNMDGVILAVSGIMLLVLIPHQLVWKPMVRESYKYKF